MLKNNCSVLPIAMNISRCRSFKRSRKDFFAVSSMNNGLKRVTVSRRKKQANLVKSKKTLKLMIKAPERCSE